MRLGVAIATSRGVADMDHHPKPPLRRPPPCSTTVPDKHPVRPADYVLAMSHDELKVIATGLVTRVRESVTIHWMVRESARPKISVIVRSILRKHGYPPDLQAEASKLVLEQAEVLCADWVA